MKQKQVKKIASVTMCAILFVLPTNEAITEELTNRWCTDSILDCEEETDSCKIMECNSYDWVCAGYCQVIEGEDGFPLCVFCDSGFPGGPSNPADCKCQGYPRSVINFDGECTATEGCHCEYDPHDGEEYTIYVCGT